MHQLLGYISHPGNLPILELFYFVSQLMVVSLYRYWLPFFKTNNNRSARLPEYLLKLEFKDYDMMLGLHAMYKINLFDRNINGYGHIEATSKKCSLYRLC